MSLKSEVEKLEAILGAPAGDDDPRTLLEREIDSVRVLLTEPGEAGDRLRQRWENLQSPSLGRPLCPGLPPFSTSAGMS